MTPLLIDAGYDNTTVKLKTRNRPHESLRNYHNLRGEIGLNQLSNIFVPFEKRKREIEVKDKNQRKGDIAVIPSGSHFNKIKHYPCLLRRTKARIILEYRVSLLKAFYAERFRLRIRFGMLLSIGYGRTACSTDLKFLA